MTDTYHPSPAAALSDRIAGIRVAMLTTLGDDSRLHSRPMVSQEGPTDGSLWFFVNGKSPMALGLELQPALNLSYVNESTNCYVSVVGKGRLVYSQERIRTMWSPVVGTWFPEGVNDPDLTMIRVDVDEADYWDGSKGRFIRLVGFVRGLMGDETQPHVDRGHLDMRDG